MTLAYGNALIVLMVLSACAAQPSRPVNELDKPFDLRCEPMKEGQPNLEFHFVPAEDDDVIVQRMGEIELRDFGTWTYQNALSWRNDKESFTVDRFTGRLVRKPSNEVYFCTKKGRRVF